MPRRETRGNPSLATAFGHAADTIAIGRKSLFVEMQSTTLAFGQIFRRRIEPEEGGIYGRRRCQRAGGLGLLHRTLELPQDLRLAEADAALARSEARLGATGTHLAGEAEARGAAKAHAENSVSPGSVNRMPPIEAAKPLDAAQAPSGAAEVH